MRITSGFASKSMALGTPYACATTYSRPDQLSRRFTGFCTSTVRPLNTCSPLTCSEESSVAISPSWAASCCAESAGAPKTDICLFTAVELTLGPSTRDALLNQCRTHSLSCSLSGCSFASPAFTLFPSCKISSASQPHLFLSISCFLNTQKMAGFRSRGFT